MAEVSDARQALRDYACEDASTIVQVSTRNTAEVMVGLRGEFVGKTFDALQEILTLCDDIRSTKKVLSPLGMVNTIEWIVKNALKR